MTTILYDGINSVASDKRLSMGNNKYDKAIKYYMEKYKNKTLIIWYAGKTSENELITNDVKKAIDKNFKDFIASYDDSQVIFYYDKKIYHFNYGCSMDITGQAFAIGSGGDYALGAFKACFNIESSMEIASELCRNTSPNINIINFYSLSDSNFAGKIKKLKKTKGKTK